LCALGAHLVGSGVDRDCSAVASCGFLILEDNTSEWGQV
jgi:hypothetical protein